MPLVGVNVEVADEATAAELPTATDTAILLTADANAPAVVTLFTRATQASDSFPTATGMQAQVDTLFGEGVQKVLAVKMAGSGAIDATLALLPAEMGPGQVVAPAVVTPGDIDKVAQWAWSTNRLYLANGPANVSDSAVDTLADAVLALGHGRNIGLYADTALIPGVGSTPRQVPFSLVVAGIIARNDIVTGNPNLAAAGVQGVARYALGVTDERSDLRRDDLTSHQVNTAKTVAGELRSYGYRTLADLDVLPHWWDLSGSRTIMDLRAHATATSESVLFGQIDAQNTLQDRWNGLLTARCLELLRLGALYGTPTDAFTVDTGPALNPVSQLAQGRLTAAITAKTSPYAEALGVTIVRERLAA